MEIVNGVLGVDWQTGVLIILNLIIIESLLSVDNAAVLATMVMDLKAEQRSKALKYGIIGAYIFRGLCLVFASWLVKIWWLKPLGGLYLLYLSFNYFKSKATPDVSDDTLNKEHNRFYKLTVGVMGPFWSTVALVELMDLAFSIDNVFAAVAFTENIYLIMAGVFIGILSMRFMAQAFVNLMVKYPFLETSAFIVIAVLGLKLCSSVLCHFQPENIICVLLEAEYADIFISLITASLFLFPIITSSLFNFPQRR